ncbi:hypothetical protein RR46_01902 [Papilio xuthus]|uniref:Uncharacterized protein n=1 Tax=Papilio xuthus TaxID=66420 RepID=A0A194QG21_PAPXU|nr:hypothetical protein RR46_01902 [Papilio xuthus]
MLVDVTIPHDENLVKAEKEKVLKYLDLAHEVTAMWRMKSTTIIIYSRIGKWTDSEELRPTSQEAVAKQLD